MSQIDSRLAETVLLLVDDGVEDLSATRASVLAAIRGSSVTSVGGRFGRGQVWCRGIRVIEDMRPAAGRKRRPALPGHPLGWLHDGMGVYARGSKG